MFCAVMLYFTPDSWISCFSTGQRASTSLLDLTAKFLLALPGAKDRIVKRNQENLFVSGSNGDVRRLYSFPSSVAGLKGQGGKLIILEEASRLDEAVFYEVCLPLLGVSNTAMVAISTPLEEDNFFSQLLVAKKPNGAPLFKVMQIRLICDACLAAKADSCPHMAGNLPLWKSTARSELVKTLMASDHQMWLREQAGVITSRDIPAFDRISIEKAFLETSRVPVGKVVPEDARVYVAIDPSGGGFSLTAVVAGVIDVKSKNMVLVGAAAEQVRSDADLEGFLNRFFSRLREVSSLAHATIVLIIETNYGGQVMASRITNICRPFPPIKVLASEQQGAKVGVTTTDVVKERSRVDLQRLLRLETFNVVREGDLISTHAGVSTELRKQLVSFKFLQNERDPRKVTLTGKTKTESDDLAMATMLLVFWTAFALTTPAALK